MPDETFEQFMSGRRTASKVAQPTPEPIEDDSFSGFMAGKESAKSRRPSRNTPANQKNVDENLFQYDFVNYARNQGINDDPDAPENRTTNYRQAWRENKLPGLNRQPSSPQQQDSRSLVAVGHTAESSIPPRPPQAKSTTIRQRPTATPQPDLSSLVAVGHERPKPTPKPTPPPRRPALTPAEQLISTGYESGAQGLADILARGKDVIGGAITGDFRPLGEQLEGAGRGALQLVRAGLGPSGTVIPDQTPGIQAVQQRRAERLRNDPYEIGANITKERLAREAAAQPGLVPDIVRGTVSGAISSLPYLAAGPGGLPAIAGTAGLTADYTKPEEAATQIAGAVLPIPLVRKATPLINRAAGALPQIAQAPVRAAGQVGLGGLTNVATQAAAGERDPQKLAAAAITGGILSGQDALRQGRGVAPEIARPAPTAGLPEPVLDRAIRNAPGGRPIPQPDISTPRLPLTRTGFDAMGPGQRVRAMQGGIGAEQPALPSTPGEMAQRPRAGGPRIPPATEPVPPQVDPARLAIQDYVAKVEQINQGIPDPIQKAEALKQAREEYRAKRAQIQQSQVVPEAATLPEVSRPVATAPLPDQQDIAVPPSVPTARPQDVGTTPEAADQAAFVAEFERLQEEGGDPVERAAAIERLRANPLFGEAVTAFNALPAKERAASLRAVPADLRQAIKQGVTLSPQKPPESVTPPQTKMTPVEIPRGNVEKPAEAAPPVVENVPRNVPQVTPEPAPIQETATPQGRTVNVSGKEIVLTPEQEARWVAEVEPQERFIKDRLRSDQQAGLGRLESDKRAKGSRMKLAALKREITGQLTAKEQKQAEVQARRDAKRAAKVADQKATDLVSERPQTQPVKPPEPINERRPVPVANTENVEVLRNRRADLVEIQARRGADLNPDLQDEIRELGSSIKTFENKSLRGQPPMEAEPSPGTATEQAAPFEYQPTPADLRKVERMRTGPATDLDPFIRGLEANRNNDITGRREMSAEERAKNRYLLEQANATRDERRRAGELGAKNPRPERPMEPMTKAERADLITKPVEEQRQVIEARKAEKAARTVTHPDEAIDGKPVIAETQDGRVVVANPENKTGVSVVKDRASKQKRTRGKKETTPTRETSVTLQEAGPRDELLGNVVGVQAKSSNSKPTFVTDAEQRLREVASGKRSGSGTQALVDQVIVTGHQIYRAGMQFQEWAREVIKSAGEKVRPHLKAAWDQITDHVSFGELPKTRAEVEQTPAFKRFFQGSKIVDENGNPKVVYHSTQADFDVFRDTADVGFHFGTQKAANDRAETPTYFKNYGKQEFRDQSSVMPVYLSIKNPLKVGDVFSTSTDTLDKLMDLGHIDRNDPNFVKIKESLKNGDIDSKKALQLRRAGIVQALEEQGYDGIEYTNRAEDPGSTSYVAFHPQQIKSAIGNRGTFSKYDPSIMGSGFGSLQGMLEKGRRSPSQPTRQSPKQIDLIAGLRKKGQPAQLTKGEQFKQSAISAAALPRALMASADVSAPLRQGAILTLPPSQWGRAARAGIRMFRGFSTKQYEAISEQIADHPDAVDAEYAGLFLATKNRKGLSGKEEDFISKWAEKIPIVKHSEQAYKTYLDSLRMDTFSKYKREIDKRGLSKDESTKAYKAAADWINIATGRGTFGKKIDDAMPALATVFFAPRYTASRFNVLNPMTYAKNLNSAGGRAVLKQQISDLVQFAGVVGGTLALASASGAEVSTDPDDPDFLKVKIGNTRYDALAGLQQPMRLLYRLGKDAARAAQGEPSPRGEGSVEILGKFARSKESPTASFVHDLLSRKDFLGREFNMKRAVVERVAPLMWKDMVEAYRREGIGGSAKMLPGAFGIGVQDYAKKPGAFAVSAPSFNAELQRMGIDYSYTQPLEGEPESLHKARSERVRSWLDEYGEQVVNEPSYRELSEIEKKRAIRALKSAITGEANKKEPNTEKFNAQAIIERARQATASKPERDRGKIYAEP